MLPHETKVVANPTREATERAKEYFMVNDNANEYGSIGQRMCKDSLRPKPKIFYEDAVRWMETFLRLSFSTMITDHSATYHIIKQVVEKLEIPRILSDSYSA
jgi:hypothetical protein